MTWFVSRAARSARSAYVWQIELDDIRPCTCIRATSANVCFPWTTQSARGLARGGPEWTRKRRSGGIASISGATIEAREPGAMAERWAGGFWGFRSSRVRSRPRLPSTPGAIDFVPAAGVGRAFRSCAWRTLTQVAALAEAKKRDLFVDGARIKSAAHGSSSADRHEPFFRHNRAGLLRSGSSIRRINSRGSPRR